MIRVYISKIDDAIKTELVRVIPTLSDSAAARLGKKKNEVLYLASLLALSLMTDEQRADLDYTPGGRPFFKTVDANVSISHSDLFAAVAISDSKDEQVGIDVEDFANFKSSVSRFFTSNEQAEFDSGTHGIAIWAKKEALFKCLGDDSVSFLSLDSTASDRCFTTSHLDGAILTLCHSGSQIEIIKK